MGRAHITRNVDSDPLVGFPRRFLLLEVGIHFIVVVGVDKRVSTLLQCRVTF